MMIPTPFFFGLGTVCPAEFERRLEQAATQGEFGYPISLAEYHPERLREVLDVCAEALERAGYNASLLAHLVLEAGAANSAPEEVLTAEKEHNANLERSQALREKHLGDLTALIGHARDLADEVDVLAGDMRTDPRATLEVGSRCMDVVSLELRKKADELDELAEGYKRELDQINEDWMLTTPLTWYAEGKFL
jgi:hypothetical protein